MGARGTDRRIVRVAGDQPNAWRLEPAERVGVIADAEAYFRVVHHALLHARRQVLILGWDIDSRVCLRRDLDAEGRRRATLAQVLGAIVARHDGPEVWALSWDFAIIYAFEREALTQLKLGWTSHRRLHFELDDMHPLGASQHQKVVVVDDAIAFCGGLDLCGGRWDTPAHRVDEPARHDPPLRPHPPFHDVQMAVTGPAAAALGDLARERWFRATGERIRPPTAGRRREPPPTASERQRRAEELWSPEIPLDFEDVKVAIARTEPAFNGRPEVREVEQLHVDAILRARRSIYIENQYFTSHSVGAALATRLREDDGPEVVLVQPRECSGWLEESTMGVLRRRLIHDLRRADAHQRLRLYFARVPDDVVRLNVHSKVTIVDDELLRVGSANLSNRSMGFDSECDLAVEAAGSPTVADHVAAVRERLLAEHLARAPDEVRAACRAHGLVGGIEVLRTAEGKTLAPLDVDVMPWLESLVSATVIIDPERAMAVDPTVNRELPAASPRRRLRAALLLGGFLVVALAFSFVWRVTPLAELLSPAAIVRVVGPVIQGPLGPLVGVLAFVVGGLVVVPLTLLTLQSGLLFGPLMGFVVAFVGAVASALVTYGVGRALGADSVRRLVGRDRLRVTRSLRTSGALAVAAFRLLPVAPFTIVNLAAGAAHIPFLPYLVGTLIGVLPGTFALTLFASGLVAAIRHPTPGLIAVVASAVLVLGAVVASLVRFVRRRQRGAPPVQRPVVRRRRRTPPGPPPVDLAVASSAAPQGA